jgi:signal transduction histidine kinase
VGPDQDSTHVLVFAPIGRDGPASADLLRRIDLSAELCTGLADLIGKIKAGAAAVFVAEEGLFGKDISSLTDWVDQQPPWSDLPFVVLTSQQAHPAVAAWRQRLTESLRNISFLERPVQAITLTSTMQAALRARARQYEVRSLLEARERAAQELEALVTARTSELKATNSELRRQMVERMQAEEALRQSQKMEAVGQLTGGLAHDFNNLLAGISGSLELLQARISQGRIKDLGRYIIAAQGAAARAAAITHRLLAFSRRQTLDPKPTDINRLIVSMEELIRRTAGPAIAVEIVLAAGLWPVLCDPNQLENALLNLCINAHDAMPDGGRLTIETANTWVDERAARERDMAPGQYVALCVTDTGTGMTPEVIKRAFDPFFTTKPIGMGTGLGLSMIHGFARQSGGQVRIYSELGEGTTMRIYLPRHHGKVEGDEFSPELAEAPRAEAGETVLIVDDEPTVRMLVTEVLEDLGYTAVEAADGAAGLHVLQSNARIDLLITDVGLPGGMNGRQVADAARQARPDIKVLFITGYAENAVLSHGHLEPGMHVLTKPFALEALASRIRDLISSA